MLVSTTMVSENKDSRAKYNKQRANNQISRVALKKSSQKHYQSKKGVRFPPVPPSATWCQNMYQISVMTLSGVFEEAGCAVCGKLTPIVRWRAV